AWAALRRGPISGSLGRPGAGGRLRVRGTVASSPVAGAARQDCGRAAGAGPPGENRPYRRGWQKSAGKARQASERRLGKMKWKGAVIFPAGVFVALAVAVDPDAKGPPKTKSVNMVVNGDFEAGETTPKGWQSVDGLTSFWVKDDDPKHGKCLKFDTSVLQS